MRIWSIHPKYLDSKGLVALWRETLLARNVLQNKTKGYKNHPQLLRFRISENPVDVINFYLTVVYKEALARKYSFDKDKIGNVTGVFKIPVTRGQVEYEFEHLLRKLKTRDSEKYLKISGITEPVTHPLFIVIEGEAEKWEIRTNHNI
jgi:hypothetical protein